MCVCQCVDLRRSDRFRIERIKYTSRDLKNTRNVVSINFVCMYVHTYVREYVRKYVRKYVCMYVCMYV